MIVEDDSDDEDDGGIPPEILEMIRVTEMLHNRAMNARPTFSRPAEPALPRNDESHEDVMKRMNKLSEEIGEEHDKNRGSRLQEKKQNRTSSVLLAISVILTIILFSFGINQFVLEDEDKETMAKQKNFKVVLDSSEGSIKVKEHKRID